MKVTMLLSVLTLTLAWIVTSASAQTDHTTIIDRKDIPVAVAAQVTCGTEPDSITRRPFAGGFVFGWRCPGNNANSIQALVYAKTEGGDGATLLRFPPPPRKGEAMEELSNIRWDDKTHSVSHLFVNPESRICRSEARWQLRGMPPVPTLIFWRETRDCTGKTGWTIKR